MSARASGEGIRADQLLGSLLWQSVPVAVVAGMVAALVFTVAVGLAAGLAALAGLVAALVFFGVDVLVLKACRNLPAVVLAAALLGEYMIKIVFLAWVLWAVSETTNVDLHALAVGVVVTVVALVAAMTRAAITTRSFYFDFDASGTTGTSGTSTGSAGDSSTAP